MSKKEDDILDEIHRNAKADRISLKEVQMDMIDMITSEDLVVPEIKVGLAEGIAKISECIHKTNMQLVELAKLKLKRELMRMNDNQINDVDKRQVFEDIGEGLVFEIEDEDKH